METLILSALNLTVLGDGGQNTGRRRKTSVPQEELRSHSPTVLEDVALCGDRASAVVTELRGEFLLNL